MFWCMVKSGLTTDYQIGFCNSLFIVDMKTKDSIFLVILVMILPVQGQLKPGFYSSSCPKAEAIVRSTVESYFNKDPTIAAGLLRLHFHDCFVQVLCFKICYLILSIVDLFGIHSD